MKAWKNAEKRIAELLGGKRLIRESWNESKPDATAKKSGFKFVIESKHRKSLPKSLTDALNEAKQYAKKDTIYIAYFHQKNEKRGLVVLEDIHFKEILESRIVEDNQLKLFK